VTLAPRCRACCNSSVPYGQAYRSLSAVAKAVTGSHWNGHLFFGLTTHKRDRHE
jgi:hypothetical protein